PGVDRVLDQREAPVVALVPLGRRGDAARHLRRERREPDGPIHRGGRLAHARTSRPAAGPDGIADGAPAPNSTAADRQAAPSVPATAGACRGMAAPGWSDRRPGRRPAGPVSTMRAA